MWRLAFVLAAFLCFCTCCSALRVRPTTSSLILEVGDEELCMYSTGKEHFEGISMHYQVIQGSDDFDVYVRNSDNRTVYASFAGEHDADDRIYFTTRTSLEHSYCIDNRPYSKSKKKIKMDIGLTSLKRWKQRIDPLSKLMRRTEGSFMGMHDDQILSRLREESLREGIEKLFSLLALRGVTETVIVILVTLLNVVLVTHLLKQVA